MTKGVWIQVGRRVVVLTRHGIWMTGLVEPPRLHIRRVEVDG